MLIRDAEDTRMTTISAVDPAELRFAMLTEREWEVFRLVAQGMSNSDIASRLYLAVPTVKKHMHNLLAKVAATDRTQAVIMAYSAGLIQGSGPVAE